MAEDPLLSVAEELYALLPSEFTPARDAEAKAARSDGDRELADRVRQLRKPSTAAWVVNMLMRHRQDEMLQVLELGESLRRAQADLDGDALRDLTRQRRQLIAAVATRGRGLANELGTKVSESVARQVEDTLHAAMIDTDAAAAVRTGLLVDPLTPAGLGSLKAASSLSEHTAWAVIDGSAPRTVGARSSSPARGRAGLSVVPEGGATTRSTQKTSAPEADEEKQTEREETERREREAAERRQAVEAADREVAEAEDALDEAKRRRRKAEKRVAKLESRGLQLQAEAEELRRRLDEIEHEVESLDEEAGEAEDRRDRAGERLDEAEARLAEARRRREGLG